MALDPWYRIVTLRKEVREGLSFSPDEFAIALVDQHRRNDGEFLPAGYAFKSLPGHFGSPAAHQYKDFALLVVHQCWIDG